jgi:hypothetical protein
MLVILVKSIGDAYFDRWGRPAVYECQPFRRMERKSQQWSGYRAAGCDVYMIALKDIFYKEHRHIGTVTVIK